MKITDALTMIGSDLASVRNMDFDKVWTIWLPVLLVCQEH